jgi:hypothetical protein
MCDVFAAHPIIYLIGLLGHSGQKICVMFLQDTQFTYLIGRWGIVAKRIRAPGPRRRPACGGRTTAIIGVATSSGERSCASLARTSGAADRSPPLQVRLKRCAITSQPHSARPPAPDHDDPERRPILLRPAKLTIGSRPAAPHGHRSKDYRERRPPRWHLNADGALQPGLDRTQRRPIGRSVLPRAQSVQRFLNTLKIAKP